MDGFKENFTNEGLMYYSIPAFDNTGLVKTCFTTRFGGISTGNYSSLNLGVKTDDKRENILENYKRVTSVLDISLRDMVLSDQVHGNHVMIVGKDHAGNLLDSNSTIKDVDGLITSTKNLALTTVFADCVPIYILDPWRKVIGIVHAGWRGTVTKIAAKALHIMTEEYKTDPKDCLTAIGPSIGKCCYEVDELVVDKFNNNFTILKDIVFQKEQNKYLLDLGEANSIILEDSGIMSRNIINSNICTLCNKEHLFSYRGAHGRTGRMAAILELI